MFWDTIAVTFGILLKVLSLYMLLMCLFFRKRTAPRRSFSPSVKFACLIPARNEEAVIGDLIRSLRQQNYPQDLIEIYAIPNNCTDDTVSAAKAAGADIIQVRGNIRNKGDALHYAIRQLLSRRDIGAFIIFDADNVADPNYLKAMNDAFLSGAQVTKSRIESKNPYDSWISGCYGLYYNIFNKFFNESRSRLGLSPKLIGTGLGISREVLLQMGGWDTVTIAEDTEFNADCVLGNYSICWVPDAVTYDETPDSFRLSLRQRRRWVGGIMAVAKERISDLFYEMRKGRNIHQLFDMAMILILPYLQVISLIPTMILMVSGILSGSVLQVLIITTAGLMGSYVGLMLFALLLAVISPYETKSMKKAILAFPIFTLSWMPLCIAALFMGGGSWEQIKHKRSVSLKDLGCITEPTAQA